MKRGTTARESATSASAAGPSTEGRRRDKKLREMDVGEIEGLLDELCEKWRLREGDRGLNFEDQTMRMFQVFGLDYRSNMLAQLDADRGSFGLREADGRIKAEEQMAIGLYHRLHELGMLPERAANPADADADGGDAPDGGGDDDPKRFTLRRIVKVLEMVFYAKRVVLCAVQAKMAVHQLHLDDGAMDLDADLDTRLGSWALRFRWIDTKTSPMQQLLLFLLDGAMEKRYRKSNGWMYEPVFVDGKNTHAWRPVMEIAKFVYSMLHKETCWEQWCNATNGGLKNISNAIEYLTNCQDYQLPELLKQRGVYAFRNGLYLAHADRFHPFDTSPLPEDVVACKFVDADFRDAACEWRDIPTPHLQSIMAYQGWPAAVCDWLYVMLGRLLYPLNELDSWQVIPFFKGSAASGKCHCLGTPILMADGSVKAVQDVGVGDAVMGDDGTPRRVLDLARGVDDMFTLVPKRKGYEPQTVTREHVLCLKYTNQRTTTVWQYGKRVMFFDGETRTGKAKKFTSDEALEAFAATIDRDEVFEMTVDEYMALPEYLKRYLVCYRVPVDFAVIEEPLFDPWTIGVWLGDGTAAHTQITNGDAEVIAGLEAAMAGTGNEVRHCGQKFRYRICGKTTGAGQNEFLEVLKTYNLRGNKHIPHALKTGSRTTRMELLAGLLDTDGWYGAAGYYEITQKNERLADDIVFVARSLGFGATKAEVQKAAVKPDGSRAWGTYHRINIFGAGLADIPLRVTRKRASKELKPVKDACKWGFDVVPAARQEYYGFQTDGNQRFLLGDFSVTHNSTIVLRVCKAFYDAQDVGVLSNNIERKFGLSAFYDKYLFVAPEIKNDLGIEQAEFQSVVSGEDLQVNVKHKKAFATTWSVPGALAGNEVPAWADNSGSVQRRVVVFEFAKSVVNGDMKLGDKLLTELPAILAKCNKAYLEMAGLHSDVNVWTVLPDYFRKTREALAQSVNSLEAFLASANVVMGPDMYCPMEDFRAALKSFEVHNNYKSKKYDVDFFRNPFQKYGLDTVKGKREYRGTNRTREWVVGLDLNNACGDDDELM